MKRRVALALAVLLAFSLALPALAGDAGEHEHQYDENGVCLICGEECPHGVWVNGVCQLCGYRCPHPRWEDSVCVQCHMRCPHEHHNHDTFRCDACGAVVLHRYEKGVCPMCGQAPWFQTEQLPMYLFAPCPHQGTVQTLTYETHDYMKERQKDTVVTRNKKLHVYLPYGYDPSKQYDVLILMHGMWGTERYWLVDEQVYYDPPEEKVHTTDLIDNMIDLGTAREMIVVTPTFYNNSDNMNEYQRNREQDQFVYELRRDILPLIVKNFSTYAAEPTEAAISAAREHFAYAGLSMGSIYGYNAVLPLCLDLFGWFGQFSGAECYTDLVISALNSENNAPYPIYWFYNAAGTADNMYRNHKDQYWKLVNNCPALTNGENATFTDIKGAMHEYKAWGEGLYNFLLVVFAR